MTRRVLLPSESEVHTALAQLRAWNENGAVSAWDLAHHVGLENATFWRHFPEIAQVIADERRTALRSAPTSPVGSTANNTTDMVLRKGNVKLRDQLELAVAHIQRLTNDNQVLLDKFEAQTNIVKLPRDGAQGQC